jgi:hypothetical protein
MPRPSKTPPITLNLAGGEAEALTVLLQKVVSGEFELVKSQRPMVPSQTPAELALLRVRVKLREQVAEAREGVP